MIEINLIPDVKQELIRAQRTRTLVITAAIITGIAAVATVIILAGWVFGVQAVRQGVADESIKKANDTLQSHTDLSKMLTIQNQLSRLSELNDGKTIYSRSFDMLASVLPPEPNTIRITDFTIDDEESLITIQGVSSNNYPALEVFIKTITATNIEFGPSDDKETVALAASQVQSADVAFGEDSSGANVLRFTLTFEYAPELFSPASTNVQFSRANEGNVTDSYLDLPQSLFTAPVVETEGN